MWWNGICWGVGNRASMIATQAYVARPGFNELWIRQKHDSNWSSWKKIG